MLYIFDGSEDGFLTAFLTAFLDEDAQISSKCEQLPLGKQPVVVQTDKEKARKAKRRLLSFDRQAAQDLDILLRCGERDSEQVAFAYLKTLAKLKRPVRDRLANLDVFRAVEYMKKVRYLMHGMNTLIMTDGLKLSRNVALIRISIL